jgi:hypothetical protein
LTKKFINAKIKLGDNLIKEKKMAKDDKSTAYIDLVLIRLREDKADLKLGVSTNMSDKELDKQIKFLEKLQDRVNNLLNDYKSKDDSHNMGIVNKFVDKMAAELKRAGIELDEADKDGLKNDIRKGLQETQEVFEVQNMSLFERIMFSISKCIGKFFSPEAKTKYETMDKSLEKESGDVVGKWAAKINEKSHSQSNDGHSR